MNLRISVAGQLPLAASGEVRIIARVAALPPERPESESTNEGVIAAVRSTADWFERYARRLDRLRERGWQLARSPALVATRTVPLHLARELARSSRDFPIGFPWEVVIAPGTPSAAVCGGLFTGHDAPDESFPPGAFPALVHNAHSGVHALALTPRELRATLVTNLRDMAANWTGAEEHLLRLAGAGDVPAALSGLATLLERGLRELPMSVWLDTEPPGTHDDLRAQDAMWRWSLRVIPLRQLVMEGARSVWASRENDGAPDVSVDGARSELDDARRRGVAIARSLLGPDGAMWP